MTLATARNLNLQVTDGQGQGGLQDRREQQEGGWTVADMLLHAEGADCMQVLRSCRVTCVM
jgi:hypothetical protein